MSSLNDTEVAAFATFIQDNHLNVKINPGRGWRNFTRGQSAPLALVIRIDDIPSLSKVMSYFTSLNQNRSEPFSVRVAAGGRRKNYSESFSFTDCAKGDVILQLTGKRFRKIQETDTPHVIRIGASTQIGNADQRLAERYDSNLPTSSLIPYVTVGGLSATDGHGTGRSQPSFSGLINAMTLCLPNGKIVRIDRLHPLFKHIRPSHLGIFGAVIDIELNCEKRQKLKRIREPMTFDAFIDRVKQGLFYEENRPYVSAMMVTGRDNEATVAIETWQPVPYETPDSNNHHRWDSFLQKLAISAQEKLQLINLFASNKSLIPLYQNYFATKATIGGALESVGPWHEQAHSQSEFPFQMDDVSYMIRIPANDSEKIASILTRVKAKLDEYSKAEFYPLIYGMYARFFQGTNGGISSSQHAPGEHILAIDMPSSVKIPGYLAFRDEMNHFFFKELNASWHFGKFKPETKDATVKQTFGAQNYENFKQAYLSWCTIHQIDPYHNILLNDYAIDLLELKEAGTKTCRSSVTAEESAEIVCPPLCAQDALTLARKLFNQIDSKDEHGKLLKKHLRMLIEKYKAELGCNNDIIKRPSGLLAKHSLLSTSPTPTKEKPPTEPSASPMRHG